MPVTINPTSITFNDGSVQSSAASTGFNTVGSYVFSYSFYSSPVNMIQGSNYAAGTGQGQMQSASLNLFPEGELYPRLFSYNQTTGGAGISGTWRWMSGNTVWQGSGTAFAGIAVRVS